MPFLDFVSMSEHMVRTIGASEVSATGPRPPTRGPARPGHGRGPAPAPLDNVQVAARLAEIADLLDVQNANAFRVRAYRQAARTLGSWRGDVRQLVQGKAMLPGIGTDLAGKIAEIAASGSCALLDELHEDLPVQLVQLLGLPGLGPKRVGILHRALGIGTVAQLHAAASAGRLRALRGFGPQLEQQLLDASAPARKPPRRYPREVAVPVADDLLAGLRALPGVKRAEAAGSLRRQRPTVGDLDLLVVVKPGSDALLPFVHGPRVRQVLASGRTRASVVLDNGMQVDVRAVPAESFGAAWLYLTGSKAHNIALRRLAQRQGLKLNEYGLFRGEDRIAGTTEAEVYRALGLRPIDPELREARGEIEAAAIPLRPATARPSPQTSVQSATAP